MKYILQILASLLYSSVFVGLLAIVTLFPMAWFFSLPVIWMVVILLFFFGLFQGLISIAQTIIFLPYAWIVKGNIVALVIALLTVVAGMIHVLVGLWQIGPEGFWQVTGTIIMSCLLIETFIGCAIILIGLESEE